MNIDDPVHNARRSAVLCNGPPLWHKAQLAVDATHVSLVTREGRLQDGADARSGWALLDAARRKRGVASSSSRRSALAATFLVLLAHDLLADARWQMLAGGSSTQPPPCPCLERHPPP